jgi:hypothetical protein
MEPLPNDSAMVLSPIRFALGVTRSRLVHKTGARHDSTIEVPKRLVTANMIDCDLSLCSYRQKCYSFPMQDSPPKVCRLICRADIPVSVAALTALCFYSGIAKLELAYHLFMPW